MQIAKTTPWEQSELQALFQESHITARQIAALAKLSVGTVYNAGRHHPIKLGTHMKLYIVINALRHQHSLPTVDTLPVQVEEKSS